jgi:hypothetical protein
MKTFKEFTSDQHQLDEGVVRKGTVAAYALQGKRYGDAAVSDYKRAQQRLRNAENTKSTDTKVEALVVALNELLSGLIAQRSQIGSISAQITSQSMF